MHVDGAVAGGARGGSRSRLGVDPRSGGGYGDVGRSGELEVRWISAYRLARGRALGPGARTARLAAAHAVRSALLGSGIAGGNAWARHGVRWHRHPKRLGYARC